jgi:hypothetical protein
MNLLTWGETTETKPAWQNAPLRAWRWALQTDGANRPGLRWASVGIFREVRFLPGDEWSGGRCGYYAVCVKPHFEIGEDHDYYDGPHCSFSLGFVHFYWMPDWCLKCMPNDGEEAAPSFQPFPNFVRRVNEWVRRARSAGKGTR